jgi:hypothetical protein
MFLAIPAGLLVRIAFLTASEQKSNEYVAAILTGHGQADWP